MEKKDKKNERPVSYPRPTETDNQLRNQNEFIDENPNDFGDASVSEVHDKKDRTEEQMNRGTDEPRK